MSDINPQPRMSTFLKILVVIAAILFALPVALVPGAAIGLAKGHLTLAESLSVLVIAITCGVISKMLFSDAKRNNQKRALIILGVTGVLVFFGIFWLFFGFGF